MAVRDHAPRLTPKHLTLEEWARLPEDVAGELVDGSLEEEEMASRSHERAVTWLAARFVSWLEPRGGDVTGSDLKYAVGPKRGRKPDLSVFLPGRPRLAGNERLTTIPPDIAVEIITPTPRDTFRDRIDKMREYARFGVRWYWLVDPATRSIEVFELGAKARYTQVEAGGRGRLRVPGCRGLALDLDALWRFVGPPTSAP